MDLQDLNKTSGKKREEKIITITAKYGMKASGFIER